MLTKISKLLPSLTAALVPIIPATTVAQVKLIDNYLLIIIVLLTDSDSITLLILYHQCR